MKHNKKVNPLTHFNNLKAEAIKKGNGQLANYKKSLKRFQGDVTGSQVASAASDASNIDARNNYINNAITDNYAKDQYKSGLSNAALMKQELLNKAAQRENSFKQSQMIDSAMKTQRKKGGSVKKRK